MKITVPTLIIDKDKCLENIRRMKEKADKNGLFFRPHFKTHQSAQVGEWFRAAGVTAITVSSVRMAAYFANNGWKDITIAFPFNQLEIDQINQINTAITLNLLVEAAESIDFMEQHLEAPVNIFIKIDTGYHRTGILAEDFPGIDRVVHAIKRSSKVKLSGFLAHAGHTYKASSVAEVSEIHEDARHKMIRLKERYQTDFPELILSLGDTPSCSLAENYIGLDEIRPGNFVFYDVMQEFIGSCTSDKIAMAVACPVVAKHSDRNEIVIYGGAVHLSKDVVLQRDGSKLFGKIVLFNDGGWSEPVPETFITALSQEHGVIKASPKFFDKVKIGDLLGVLPVHSCLTADLLKSYFTIDGEMLDCMPLLIK